MPDQKTIERVQQERHSANHDRLYQATKKEVEAAKNKAKKVQTSNNDKKIKDIQELLQLIDKKIIALEKEMIAMREVHLRIRTRMGL